MFLTANLTSILLFIFKEMPQQMAILLDFIKVNRLRLVDWFFRFDKDHSGDISREEFKVGLKETGLKMTQVGRNLYILTSEQE